MSPIDQETKIFEHTSDRLFIKKSDISESLKAVMFGERSFLRLDILPDTLKVAVFNHDYLHGLQWANEIVPLNVEMYVHESIAGVVQGRAFKTYTTNEGETNQQVLDRIYAEVCPKTSPQEEPEAETKPEPCQYQTRYADLISRSAIAFAAKRAPEILAEIEADVNDGSLILLKAYEICDRYLSGTNIERVILAFGQYFPREDIVVIPHPTHSTRYKISLQVASS